MALVGSSRKKPPTKILESDKYKNQVKSIFGNRVWSWIKLFWLSLPLWKFGRNFHLLILKQEGYRYYKAEKSPKVLQ